MNMPVFFDSSALVAAYLKQHKFYSRARPWLQKAEQGVIEMAVCTHSLAEVFNTLTQPRYKAYLSDEFVRDSIIGHIEQKATLLSLSATDYLHTVDRLVDQKLRFKGIIYDGILAQAALNTGAERLLTFNPDDFTRFGGEIARIVHVP